MSQGGSGSKMMPGIPASGAERAEVPSLYRVGVACGLAAVAIAAVQITIEVVAWGVAGIPVPSTVEGWFELLQRNRLVGLTELTGLQVPMFALLVPFYLALYEDLRSVRPVAVLLGTTFALIGIAVYLASNTAFSMAALSDHWAAAPTMAERSTVIAAGHAMLALYDGPGLDAGVFLVIMATLAISWTQLGSRTFGRIGPAAGIVAGVIGLAYYPAVVMSSVRIFILEVAAPIFLVWVLLSARELRRRPMAGRTGSPPTDMKKGRPGGPPLGIEGTAATAR